MANGVIGMYTSVSMFLLIQIFFFSLADVAHADERTRASLSNDNLNLVGWRLPSKIVLSRDFLGVARLREVSAGVPIVSDAYEDGEPTDLMKAIVSILHDLQDGRIEVHNGRVFAVGGAQPVSSQFKRRVARDFTAQGLRIVELKIDAPGPASAQWAADQSTPDRIELTGFVRDEDTRAQLIAIARDLPGYPIVFDRMRVASRLPVAFGQATIAMLSQLRSLDRGLVGVFGNKVDIAGASRDMTSLDQENACRSILSVTPKHFACGIIDVDKGPRKGDERATRGMRKPFEAIPPEAQKDRQTEFADPRVVDILYATTRKRENESILVPRYGGDRGDKLALGLARVRIPDDHKIGRLELPGGYSLFGITLTQNSDPQKHFILRSCQSLTQQQWDSLIENKSPTEAIVFVHGFNTLFNDSIYRFSQIVWDLQYHGLPVLFSWASKGGVLDYQYDRESALYARNAFLSLLSNLREKHHISTVHIIAHSMGNFLVLEALTRQQGIPARGLGQLIMAAPDVDRDQFVQDISSIKQIFRGLTLYASSADWALKASKRLAGDVPRAGDVPSNGPIIATGLESIDVTALGDEMFGLNHNTFARSRSLMNDIKLLLTEGRHAPRLAEVLPMPMSSKPPRYWRFAP